MRATSAAPTYFKSFFHEPTKITFNDGGIKFNNPIFIADNERKLVWPDLAEQDPDILLSIGTGYNSKAKANTSNPGPRSKIGMEGYVRRMLRIALDAIQGNLDCEATWRDFISRLPKNDEKCRKYARLNPDFENTLPRLDDVKQIDYLQTRTKQTFSSNPGWYEPIAETLIASLFYFEMDGGGVAVEEEGIMVWRCQGTTKLCILRQISFF